MITRSSPYSHNLLPRSFRYCVRMYSLHFIEVIKHPGTANCAGFVAIDSEDPKDMRYTFYAVDQTFNIRDRHAVSSHQVTPSLPLSAPRPPQFYAFPNSGSLFKSCPAKRNLYSSQPISFELNPSLQHFSQPKLYSCLANNHSLRHCSESGD